MLGVATLALGAWLAYRPAVDRYKLWKQQRALAQARQFIEKRDAPKAKLALDVALTTVPGNPETIRVAAAMLEQIGAAQAMRLRRAVARLAPDSAEDAAALVLCCIRFRDFNAARDALRAMPPALAIKPPALRAALAYALSTDDTPVADAIFNRLREQFPNDDGLGHTHALLRLKHPREEQRLAAHRELEEIARRNPKLAPQINREFVGYALQQRDYADAKARLRVLLAATDATLSDHLQQANIDLLVEQQPFEAVFARVLSHVGKTEGDAAQFLQWLLVQNRAAEADRWLASVGAPLRQTTALKGLEADTVAQLKDWDRLGKLLEDGAWGPLSKETLRLVFAARAVNSPTRATLRRETWEVALESARDNVGTLRVLLRLASLWQWDDEAERTLWTVARTFPDQTWAHQGLFNVYREKKDTVKMRSVLGALRESDGSVPRFQHDWALLTLLLDPTGQWNQPKTTLQQLYESHPTDPNYATGYAFALAQSGKGTEALAIVRKLTPGERDYPPRQPYLAFVFGVAKAAGELKRTTTLAAGATFLPEENNLFTRAREELARKPEKASPTKAAANSKKTDDKR